MTTNPHKPAAVVDALREILVVDKLPIGFLLGAGCASSIEVGRAPLIPAAKGLTEAVLEQASDADLADSFKRLHEMLVEDGEAEPTIEHLLTHVRAMATVVGNERVRGFSKQDIAGLERLICQTISTLVNKSLPAPMTPYHQLARWVGERRNKSIIFTTNYDLLVEQAFESLQVPFFDGFVGSHQPFFSHQAIEQDRPAHWTLLCKIHGSINWRLVQDSNTIVRSMSGEGDQLLIHPSHLKYTESRRMPYFVMLDQLKQHISNNKKSTALFTVGYSFSDEHINDTIVDSLRANPSALCYALQYDQLSEHQQIRSLAQRCSNLHVLAPDSAITEGRHSCWAECSLADIDEFDGAFRSKRPKTRANEEDGENERDSVDVEFCLGDFVTFGRFLASFVSRRTLLGQA